MEWELASVWPGNVWKSSKVIPHIKIAVLRHSKLRLLYLRHRNWLTCLTLVFTDQKFISKPIMALAIMSSFTSFWIYFYALLVLLSPREYCFFLFTASLILLAKHQKVGLGFARLCSLLWFSKSLLHFFLNLFHLLSYGSISVYWYCLSKTTRILGVVCVLYDASQAILASDEKLNFLSLFHFQPTFCDGQHLTGLWKCRLHQLSWNNT